TAPSASFSTRSMVAPGTAARAAALALSAVVPVSSFSTTPLAPTWPPLVGSKAAAGGVVAEPAGEGLGEAALATMAALTSAPPRTPATANVTAARRPNLRGLATPLAVLRLSD